MIRQALFGLVLMVSTPAAAADCWHVFVSLGQSNTTSVGVGPYSDQYAATHIDARIKQLGRYGENNLRIIPIGNAINGAVYDGLQHWKWTPGKIGYGYTIPFARRYIVNGWLPQGCRVLIVPAGRGGTSVLEWLGELIVRPESALLYSDMVGRLRYALSLPNAQLSAINISLGESDVKLSLDGLYGMTPAVHRDKFQELILKLKADLPPAPIFATQFVPSWYSGDPIKAEIEANIRDVVEAHGGKIVHTTNLNSNAAYSGVQNDPHFSGSSMVILGNRHYNAWANILGTASRKTR